MILTRFAPAFFALAALASAQIHPDPVLARMVPPGAVMLLGVRMDRIKTTPMYRMLVTSGKLADLDTFTRQTGFDPRRDVRELLLAASPSATGAVLLARGSFHVIQDGGLKVAKHGEYAIHQQGEFGYCLLDSTTAAAGPLPMLYAALDHWHSGAPPATPKLLDQTARIPASSQIWGVSLGGFNVPGTLSMSKGSLDFGPIFRGVEQTVFWADLSGGVDAVLEADVKTEGNAKDLTDAANGLIGMGRLTVPQNHEELFRFWDGFKAVQQGRRVSLTIHVKQDMLSHLADMLQSGELQRSLHPPTL